MLAHTLIRALGGRLLASRAVGFMAGPSGVDSYTELVDKTWTRSTSRAKVVDVSRTTSRSVTLKLHPNAVFTGLRAGQHVNVTVEINGRRHTRCYSPAGAQGEKSIELTIALHDDGVVSAHLFHLARPGMVVGFDGVGGDFVLPTELPRRILFVSGGSGITPVLAMVRTLRAQRSEAEIGFIHYARSPEQACYREELEALSTVEGLRVLRGYTRASGQGQLQGHFGPEHVAAALPEPEAVYVCGPPELIDAVTEHFPDAYSESFIPRFHIPADTEGGAVTFIDSGITVASDGRPLLEQAESAGLEPYSGCRVGICRTCTRRKSQGAVRNLLTGEVSKAADEDIQICTSVPLGDVEVAL